MPKIKDILYIYCSDLDTFQNSSKDYNDSFGKYSKNNIHYKDFSKFNWHTLKNISIYHCIVISWNCIGYISYHFNRDKNLAKLVDILKYYMGILIFFEQDEPLYNKQRIDLIHLLKPSIIYHVSGTTQEARDIIFKYNNCQYVRSLTGYVEKYDNEILPIKDRKINVFYSGTSLEYAYGQLGQDKINISKISDYLENNNINNNIINVKGWFTNDSKTKTSNWIKNLSNSKITLATECGTNICPLDDLKIKIQNILKTRPNYTFEEAEKDFNLNRKDILSGQVSPKMFEAAVLKTALVMFEGDYAGIFKPGIHFIELKKNFSNIEDVLNKIKDDDFLQNMVDRTYKDIVESNKYSYEKFIKEFDEMLTNLDIIKKYNNTTWRKNYYSNEDKLKYDNYILELKEFMKKVEVEPHNIKNGGNYKQNKHFITVVSSYQEKFVNTITDAIKQKHGEILEKHFDYFKKIAINNDSFGTPVKFDTIFSSIEVNNLKYLFHTLNILTYLRSLNKKNVNIYEIGGGDGGLSYWIHSVSKIFDIKINTYTVFDLDIVCKLQNYFFKHLNVNSKSLSEIPDFKKEKVEYNFLISNYAYSEIHVDYKNIYMEKLFPIINNGYITWNHVNFEYSLLKNLNIDNINFELENVRIWDDDNDDDMIIKF